MTPIQSIQRFAITIEVKFAYYLLYGIHTQFNLKMCVVYIFYKSNRQYWLWFRSWIAFGGGDGGGDGQNVNFEVEKWKQLC